MMNSYLQRFPALLLLAVLLVVAAAPPAPPAAAQAPAAPRPQAPQPQVTQPQAPRPQPQAAQPQAPRPQTLAPPPSPSTPPPPPVAVVCLDPGHGGKDVGVGGAGILEKDLTLAVCQRVRGMLEGRGYKVYLTRAGDFALPLDERAGLANHRQVEAFVSLHADYGVSPAASGPKLYSYAEPAPEVVRPGAQATNPANWRRVSALTRSEGVRLARAIALGFEEAGTPAMAVREAPLAVLAGARMPAVVVEVGVLPAQAAKLTRPDTQNELARAIARGIEIFFRPGEMPAGATPAAVTP